MKKENQKRKITEITEEEAIRIALMLGVGFVELLSWEDDNKIMIGLEKARGDTEEKIYISGTGHVEYAYNNGEPGGCGYRSINTLPVTDYLRLVGIEFDYSAK